MIESMLCVLFVLTLSAASNTESSAGCNGSLDTCIVHTELSVPEPEPHASPSWIIF